MKFGRFAHDKLVLNKLDTHTMIAERSVSVALVDAAICDHHLCGRAHGAHAHPAMAFG